MRLASKNSNQPVIGIPVLLILILEIIAITFWFFYTQPESNAISGLFNSMGILFGINIMLAGVLRLGKSRLALFFLANALFCPLVYFAGWILWFTYWG